MRTALARVLANDTIAFTYAYAPVHDNAERELDRLTAWRLAE